MNFSCNDRIQSVKVRSVYRFVLFSVGYLHEELRSKGQIGAAYNYFFFLPRSTTKHFGQFFVPIVVNGDHIREVAVGSSQAFLEVWYSDSL